jgi:lysosomal acid phosphatase
MFLLYGSHGWADELIFAVDIIRHGDRSPIIDIPKSPYAWPQALGELSQEGMRQEYQLGKMKRIQYVEKYHLLPENYLSTAMLVRSTDYNRTLMSAQAFLLGLYPLTQNTVTDAALPANYQPVPIHTVSEREENLLSNTYNKVDALLVKYFYSQKSWSAKQKQIDAQIQQWRNITGLKLKTPNSIIALGDHLYVRKLHHIDMPRGVTPQMADDMIVLGRWLFLAEYQTYAVSRGLSQNLLTLIAEKFARASAHKTMLKYILFSAHDGTILGVLSALHHPQADTPEYASDLNFLLFKNSSGNFYVRVLYNNKPMTLPACAKDCPLDTFNKIMRTT